MKKHHTFVPMIPQWFGHLESTRIISKQDGAQPLDQRKLFDPLILQQERLREASKLSPCTENIQGLFSNVLNIIQDTDTSPEGVMQETSEALTKLSHAMENPAKPLLLKKLSEAEIALAYTITRDRILGMSTNSPTATPTATPPLMRKSMSRVFSGIWTNNPVFDGGDEDPEIS